MSLSAGILAVHGEEDVNINEAIRIQTFPDDYIFCGNKGSVYTQIGNAVPCKLAEAVAKAVLQYIQTEH